MIASACLAHPRTEQRQQFTVSDPEIDSVEGCEGAEFLTMVFDFIVT